MRTIFAASTRPRVEVDEGLRPFGKRPRLDPAERAEPTLAERLEGRGEVLRGV